MKKILSLLLILLFLINNLTFAEENLNNSEIIKSDRFKGPGGINLTNITSKEPIKPGEKAKFSYILDYATAESSSGEMLDGVTVSIPLNAENVKFTLIKNDALEKINENQNRFLNDVFPIYIINNLDNFFSKNESGNYVNKADPEDFLVLETDKNKVIEKFGTDFNNKYTFFRSQKTGKIFFIDTVFIESAENNVIATEIVKLVGKDKDGKYIDIYGDKYIKDDKILNTAAYTIGNFINNYHKFNNEIDKDLSKKLGLDVPLKDKIFTEELTHFKREKDKKDFVFDYYNLDFFKRNDNNNKEMTCKNEPDLNMILPIYYYNINYNNYTEIHKDMSPFIYDEGINFNNFLNGVVKLPASNNIRDLSLLKNHGDGEYSPETMYDDFYNYFIPHSKNPRSIRIDFEIEDQLQTYDNFNAIIKNDIKNLDWNIYAPVMAKANFKCHKYDDLDTIYFYKDNIAYYRYDYEKGIIAGEENSYNKYKNSRNCKNLNRENPKVKKEISDYIYNKKNENNFYHAYYINYSVFYNFFLNKSDSVKIGNNEKYGIYINQYDIKDSDLDEEGNFRPESSIYQKLSCKTTRNNSDWWKIGSDDPNDPIKYFFDFFKHFGINENDTYYGVSNNEDYCDVVVGKKVSTYLEKYNILKNEEKSLEILKKYLEEDLTNLLKSIEVSKNKNDSETFEGYTENALDILNSYLNDEEKLKKYLKSKIKEDYDEELVLKEYKKEVSEILKNYIDTDNNNDEKNKKYIEIFNKYLRKDLSSLFKKLSKTYIEEEQRILKNEITKDYNDEKLKEYLKNKIKEDYDEEFVFEKYKKQIHKKLKDLDEYYYTSSPNRSDLEIYEKSKKYYDLKKNKISFYNPIYIDKFLKNHLNSTNDELKKFLNTEIEDFDDYDSSVSDEKKISKTIKFFLKNEIKSNNNDVDLVLSQYKDFLKEMTKESRKKERLNNYFDFLYYVDDLEKTIQDIFSQEGLDTNEFKEEVDYMKKYFQRVNLENIKKVANCTNHQNGTVVNIEVPEAAIPETPKIPEVPAPEPPKEPEVPTPKTPKVPNYIKANDDEGKIPNYQDNVINILGNDTLNNEKVDLNNYENFEKINISLIGENDIFELRNGNLVVFENNQTGKVNVDYKICEKINPENCSIATVTLDLFDDPKKEICGVPTIKERPIYFVEGNIIGYEEIEIPAKACETPKEPEVPKVQKSKVIVEYIDKKTNHNISETKEIIGNVGDNYETSKIDIENYSFDSVSGEQTGVFKDNNIFVKYYYNKDIVPEKPSLGAPPCKDCFVLVEDPRVLIPIPLSVDDINIIIPEPKNNIPEIPKEPETPENPKIPEVVEPEVPLNSAPPKIFPFDPTPIIKEKRKGIGEFIEYPKMLPQTGPSHFYEIVQKAGIAGAIFRENIDISLPDPKNFWLAGSTNTSLDYWLQVVPEDLRNKDKYIVLPSEGLVMPINSVQKDTLEYKKFIHGENEDFREFLRDGAVEIPGTSVYNYGEIGRKVISAHSSYWYSGNSRYKTHFQKIIGLKDNDEIWVYIKNNDGVFERFAYKTFKSYNTSKNDISILKPSDDKILNLFTCTPIGGSAGRWIVEAKFIGKF